MWYALWVFNAQVASDHYGETLVSNQLYSIALNIDPNNLPPGMAVTALGTTEPNQATHVWDPDTQNFVEKPTDEQDDRDQITNLMADPEWNDLKMSRPNERQLRRLIAKHMPGSDRRGGSRR